MVRTLLKIFPQIVAQLSHKSRNCFPYQVRILFMYHVRGCLKQFKRQKQGEEENVWKINMADCFLAFQLLLQLYFVMCVS